MKTGQIQSVPGLYTPHPLKHKSESLTQQSNLILNKIVLLKSLYRILFIGVLVLLSLGTTLSRGLCGARV